MKHIKTLHKGNLKKSLVMEAVENVRHPVNPHAKHPAPLAIKAARNKP
jgi:hypothetical protein